MITASLQDRIVGDGETVAVRELDAELRPACTSDRPAQVVLVDLDPIPE